MFQVSQLKDVVRLGRPKFVIYSNVMYTVGVAVAYRSNPQSTFYLWLYIWTCLLVHAIQLMTHYFNEFYDYEADLANKSPSPWSGGSRVLVERKFKPKVSLDVARISAVVILVNVIILYLITGNTPLTITLILGVILGHGYSAWPLKTSRRGLGELTVCLVLNILAPLAGYQFLDPGNPLGSSLLWPILLSLLPIQFVRMMVMNMADYEGDKIADKRTLVVRLGLDVASNVHAVGMVCAHIFLVWLFYAAYISKLTFLLLLIPAPIGLRQIHNVLARPWIFDNPFWSSQHNLVSMSMALTAVLLSGGRPLTGASWALVFPLVLIFASVPVFVMKNIHATTVHDAHNGLADGKDE